MPFHKFYWLRYDDEKIQKYILRKKGKAAFITAIFRNLKLNHKQLFQDS